MSYAADSETGNETNTGRTAIQLAAAAVGVVFLAVGIVGFIPGITTHYSSMSFASHMSGSKLLGIFQVSVLHNIVHLLFGLAGLALARSARAAHTYLLGGGAVYLVLFLYGILIQQNSPANFVPVNPADDVLHLALGIGMAGLGLALNRRRNYVAAAKEV